jgi:hypothetical protein
MGTVHTALPPQTLYVTIRRDELRQLKDERDQLKQELAQLRSLPRALSPNLCRLSSVNRTPDLPRQHRERRLSFRHDPLLHNQLTKFSHFLRNTRAHSGRAFARGFRSSV